MQMQTPFFVARYPERDDWGRREGDNGSDGKYVVVKWKSRFKFPKTKNTNDQNLLISNNKTSDCRKLFLSLVGHLLEYVVCMTYIVCTYTKPHLRRFMRLIYCLDKLRIFFKSLWTRSGP